MTTHYDAQDLRAIENSNLLRADANETIFFARQLEHVKSRTYDIKRQIIDANHARILGALNIHALIVAH